MAARFTLLIVGGLTAAGCGVATVDEPLPDTRLTPIDDQDYVLVARMAHITDAHVTDEESPGRLSALARANASAWRPQERYSIHLLDGTLRAINVYHARVAPIDFVVHTGDSVDNAQTNELAWLLDCFDGRSIDPLSGEDDRPIADRGPLLLDAHAVFPAEGLYRHGVHGDLPSIPWYTTVGNHDRYAVGVFPIVRNWDGTLRAPLPGGPRIGLFLPIALAPDGAIAYGPISPAYPGPPPELSLPSFVLPNPDRRFITSAEWFAAHQDTATTPPGHGFTTADQTWYSVVPVPGLRLVALDTTIPIATIPTAIYESGAIITAQREFLENQLREAAAADQCVVLLTHHPSMSLAPALGSALTPAGLRNLLNEHPNVVAHLAGHNHRQRVWDRGGYLEFETSAIIDAPQESRIIEIWRARDDSTDVVLRYAVFSHLYEGSAFEAAALDPAPTDPWHPLRREAADLARDHAGDFNLEGAGKRWLENGGAGGQPWGLPTAGANHPNDN